MPDSIKNPSLKINVPQLQTRIAIIQVKTAIRLRWVQRAGVFRNRKKTGRAQFGLA